MPSRKVDELSTEVDDASLIVEELQIAPDKDTPGKLDELHKTLEHASDTIDELEDKDS
jgi:hypothetical protein